MIKELVQFTDALDEEFKTIGIVPKEGLHVFLSYETDSNNELSISPAFRYEVYSKKQRELSNLLKAASSLSQIGWMVNTSKCFDLPAKGIHSCSPYCLAFKRESVKGGGKFNDAKTKLYERVNGYFAKATELLEDPTEKERVIVFRNALNSEEKIHHYLDQIPEYKNLKDGEYVIFYLDLLPEKYLIPSEKYLNKKLFNTEEYNKEGTDGQVYGTNNFLNGFNSKKPYLMHQSATFNITGRISAKEARALFEFQNLIERRNMAGQKIFPNPLPIFVYADEREASVSLFKRDALEGGTKRGYRVIIEELQNKLKKELGNYYLLFYQMGEVKDFDYVSRFEYTLFDKRRSENNWLVQNFFLLKEGNDLRSDYRLRNVFDLFWGLFNIALGDKYNKSDNFFDELKEENYKENDGGKNDLTLSIYRKYRRAIYDYIYKSRREILTANVFKEIMMSGIKDDLKYSRSFKIKEKLNIYFSLNHHFDTQNINFNGHYMPDKLDQLLNRTMQIADSNERIAIEDETEFAFICGQMIDFLVDKSKSADNSHAALEGFLQKANAYLFKNEIAKLFRKYLHAIERDDNGRVKRLMREIMAFDKETDMQKLMTFVLAGYFSPTFYFTKKKSETN